MKLAIKDIRREPDLQLRDGLDMDRVKAMTEFETEGGTLPPVTVVGPENFLADGHHRVHVAERQGRTEIEANRKPGGKVEAIVISLVSNDTAQSQPLTRDQRNEGIKYLLKAGWTQDKIAKATGVARSTIVNIDNALAMRGASPRATKAAGSTGGRAPKAVAVLPKAVHSVLSDTTLTRIAGAGDVKTQQKLAAAVAATATVNPKTKKTVVMSEPRVREAIKAIKADPTLDVAEAVAEAAGSRSFVPTPMDDIAKQVRRRLKNFLAETMTVDGTDYDFWQVIDVLAAHLRTTAFAGDLHAEGLAQLLAEVSVKADRAATALRVTPVAVAGSNGVGR